MIHLINGQAGNIESHSVFDEGKLSPVTAILDHTSYGFSKLSVMNSTHSLWEFVKGQDGSIGDYLWIVKE